MSAPSQFIKKLEFNDWREMQRFCFIKTIKLKTEQSTTTELQQKHLIEFKTIICVIRRTGISFQALNGKFEFRTSVGELVFLCNLCLCLSFVLCLFSWPQSLIVWWQTSFVECVECTESFLCSSLCLCVYVCIKPHLLVHVKLWPSDAFQWSFDRHYRI